MTTTVLPIGLVPRATAGMKRFYVSVMFGQRKNPCVSGPYDTHAEALALVDKVRDVLCEQDPGAWFFAYGTAGVATEQPGFLQRKGFNLQLTKGATN